MMTGTSGRICLALGKISRPVIPGMLMSDRISISDCSMVLAMRPSASAAELAKSSQNVARAGRAGIAGGTAPRRRVRHPPREPIRSRLTSGFACNNACPRQHDPEFSEFAGLGIDIDRATVLFHDDVVTHRQAKPGAFARRLGREERIEHLFLHLGRNAGAVIAYPDLHVVPEIPGCRTEDRVKPRANLRLAPGYRVKSVRDQIQEYTGYFLRKHFDCTRHLVEVSLQGHVELRLFGARAVIGQIEALVH